VLETIAAKWICIRFGVVRPWLVACGGFAVKPVIRKNACDVLLGSLIDCYAYAATLINDTIFFSSVRSLAFDISTN
jgi:hypothetical protein